MRRLDEARETTGTLNWAYTWRRLWFSATALWIFGCLPAVGQDEAESEEVEQQLEVRGPGTWTYEIAPYVWFSGVTGDTEVGPLEGELDADFGDIFDILESAIMLHAEANNGRWGAFTDLMYMQVEQRGGGDLVSVKTEFEQVIWEFGGFRRWGAGKHTMDLLFGGRLVYFDLDLNPSVGASRSKDKMFVDPIIGGRFGHTFSEKWSTSLRADIGGFGVGSDFTVNAGALAAYHFNERIRWSFGYRYMNMDYEGSAVEVDLSLHGPITGVSIGF